MIYWENNCKHIFIREIYAFPRVFGAFQWLFLGFWGAFPGRFWGFSGAFLGLFRGYVGAFPGLFWGFSEAFPVFFLNQLISKPNHRTIKAKVDSTISHALGVHLGDKNNLEILLLASAPTRHPDHLSYPRCFILLSRRPLSPRFYSTLSSSPSTLLRCAFGGRERPRDPPKSEKPW